MGGGLARLSSVGAEEQALEEIVGDKYVSQEYIDLSHFFIGCRLAWLDDDFGDLRATVKLSGDDIGRWYSIKMRDKERVAAENSGKHTVFAELAVLNSMKKHVFVQSIHYAFPGPEHVYLVLDIALAGTLAELNPHRVSESRARFYSAQIVLALGHVHSSGIIHRDVTLDSVLLLANGYVKLGNFSCARQATAATGLVRALSGTDGYLSPERCASDTNVDISEHGAPADWFALGVCLHELLTGTQLYGDDAQDRLAAYGREKAKRRTGGFLDGKAKPADGEEDAVDLDEMRAELQGLLFTKHEGSGEEVSGSSEVSEAAVACCSLLLALDVDDRLGTASPWSTGSKSVCAHDFFDGVQWDQLCEWKVEVEWKPNVAVRLEAIATDGDHGASAKTISAKLGQPRQGERLGKRGSRGDIANTLKRGSRDLVRQISMAPAELTQVPVVRRISSRVHSQFDQYLYNVKLPTTNAKKVLRKKVVKKVGARAIPPPNADYMIGPDGTPIET